MDMVSGEPSKTREWQWGFWSFRTTTPFIQTQPAPPGRLFHTAAWTIQSHCYEMAFERSFDGRWMVEFARLTPTGLKQRSRQSVGLAALPTIRTATEVVQTFLTLQDRPAFWFSSECADASRLRVYDRLAHRWGETYQVDRRRDGRSIVYDFWPQ